MYTITCPSSHSATRLALHLVKDDPYTVVHNLNVTATLRHDVFRAVIRLARIICGDDTTVTLNGRPVYTCENDISNNISIKLFELDRDVLDIIVSHLDQVDCYNIRLVCKDMRSLVKPSVFTNDLQIKMFGLIQYGFSSDDLRVSLLYDINTTKQLVNCGILAKRHLNICTYNKSLWNFTFTLRDFNKETSRLYMYHDVFTWNFNHQEFTCDKAIGLLNEIISQETYIQERAHKNQDSKYRKQILKNLVSSIIVKNYIWRD